MNRILVFVFACLTLLSFQAPAEGFLKVGLEPNLKPFAYMGEDGKVQGFDVDIANEVCKDLGKTCVFVPTEWDGLIPALRVGKIDVVISSMTITDERRLVIDFSRSYYHAASHVVVRKGYEDLKGERIGVLRGSTDEQYAKDILAPHGVEIVSYSNQNEIFLDMAAGRIVGSLTPQLEVQFGFLDTPAGKDFKFWGEPLNDTKYFGYGIGMGVSKANPELTGALNRSITMMRDDGRWQKISDRYFSIDIW